MVLLHPPRSVLLCTLLLRLGPPRTFLLITLLLRSVLTLLIRLGRWSPRWLLHKIENGLDVVAVTLGRLNLDVVLEDSYW